MSKIKRNIEALYTNHSKGIFKKKTTLKNVHQPYAVLDKNTYILENGTTINVSNRLYIPNGGGSDYWRSLNLYSFS